MRRLQMKRQEFKGEITLFLSMVFVLLLSFIGGMLQSASIHVTKSMKRADTKLALESVFAEYETQILEEYDIFVKSDADEQTLSRRLWFYGAKNMEHQIQKIKLLTDSNGQAFYEQAVRSMGGEHFEIETISEEDWQDEEREVHENLDTMLGEGGQSLPADNNPLETTKHLKESNFLKLILPESQKLSEGYINLDDLPSHRTLRKGTTDYQNVSTDGITQKFLFSEYLGKHFPSFVENKTGEVLSYELEYLLVGEESDQENLESTMKKILTIRTGINYAYLLTAQAKQAEAEAMAATLCSLLTVPEITSVVKQAILFAWAYGEGIQDLRVLAKGKKVPTTKTDETWQLSLEGLLKLGTEQDDNTTKESQSGMDYKSYVKALVLTENTENLCNRALDLIELNTGVRLDNCVTAVQIKSTCEMQRGIRDTFITEYCYK